MSCEGWEALILENVCDISSSKRIYAREYQDSGVPFYRGKEIIEKFKGNKISTKLFVSEKKFIDLEKKFGAPKQGDILLSSVGTLGVPYLVQNEKFYFKDGNLTWFKNFETNCDSRFVYWWLQSPAGQNQINNKAIGSTQKALTIDTLKKFDIQVPPLAEQKAIVATLSCIDDKIELNNRMNDTLEQMAQAIFKSWFVDFEPFQDGEFEDSELGKIPKGWKVGTLENIAEQIKINCRIEEIASGSVYIGLEHIPRKKMILDTVGKIDDVSSNKLKFEKNQIVFGKIRPYFHKVSLSPLSGYCSTDAIVIMAKVSEYLYFTFLHIFSDSFIKYAVLVSHGTKMPRAEWKSLKDYVIVIPPMEIVQNFNETIQPLFKKMMKNDSENKRLSAIRDALLPKLMSGEIRVPVESAE